MIGQSFTVPRVYTATSVKIEERTYPLPPTPVRPGVVYGIVIEGGVARIGIVKDNLLILEDGTVHEIEYE